MMMIDCQLFCFVCFVFRLHRPATPHTSQSVVCRQPPYMAGQDTLTLWWWPQAMQHKRWNCQARVCIKTLWALNVVLVCYPECAAFAFANQIKLLFQQLWWSCWYMFLTCWPWSKQLFGMCHNKVGCMFKRVSQFRSHGKLADTSNGLWHNWYMWFNSLVSIM